MCIFFYVWTVWDHWFILAFLLWSCILRHYRRICYAIHIFPLCKDDLTYLFKQKKHDPVNFINTKHGVFFYAITSEFLLSSWQMHSLFQSGKKAYSWLNAWIILANVSELFRGSGSDTDCDSDDSVIRRRSNKTVCPFSVKVLVLMIIMIFKI